MPGLWSSGGAGHRPLELNLGRRGGGDPSATVNSAKCVISDSYGRGFQRTPPNEGVRPLSSELTRAWSQPAFDYYSGYSQYRPSTGSAASGRSRASSRSSSCLRLRDGLDSRRERELAPVGRHSAYQLQNGPAWPRCEMPRPTNATYGSFHATVRPWPSLGLHLSHSARQF